MTCIYNAQFISFWTIILGKLKIQEKPGQLQWRCSCQFVLAVPCAEEPWRAFSLLARSFFETKSTKYNLSKDTKVTKLVAQKTREWKIWNCILHRWKKLMFSFWKKKMYEIALNLLSNCISSQTVHPTLEMRRQTSAVCSHAFPDPSEHSSRCFHNVQPWGLLICSCPRSFVISMKIHGKKKKKHEYVKVISASQVSRICCDAVLGIDISSRLEHEVDACHL